MRKSLYISLIAIFSISPWSCSEKIMDEINTNVNDPTDLGTRLIITDAITSSAFNLAGGDFAFYASVYIEHNTGTFGQFYNAEIRAAEPTASTTYNNTWNSVYQNLYNLKSVINKCSDEGSEKGNYHTLGIAQTLTAYNLAALTDMMGDVPWSEALQPGKIYTPVLDRQSDIYSNVFKLLDDAIANFDKTTVFPSLGAQDLLYGGNISLWKKFAYGLKARYTMRLSLRTPAYDDVISFAGQSFATASEQAQFNYNGSTTNSPFYQIFVDRDYYGASQSLSEKLSERNDPRSDVFFMPYPGTGSTLVFAPNGNPNQVQGFYSVSAISSKTAPTYLLSYHELQFLIAEAFARKNDMVNAEASLRKAVSSAFQKVNIGLSSTDADSYFDASVKPRFTANPLSEIMNQKYIAFYEEEAIEAFNDYRRLKAMGDNVVTLKNSRNTTLFPLRFSYGASDVTANTYVRDAYGDGTYVYSENVWWAGGAR